ADRNEYVSPACGKSSCNPAPTPIVPGFVGRQRHNPAPRGRALRADRKRAVRRRPSPRDLPHRDYDRLSSRPPETTSMANDPILVVGAGPTGVLLASELLRHGVACRLVEKQAKPAEHSRAAGVHSRTIEVLDALKLADELIGRGVKVHANSIFTSKRKIAGFTFDELDAPFPFILCVPQTETEDVLRKHHASLGGT